MRKKIQSFRSFLDVLFQVLLGLAFMAGFAYFVLDLPLQEYQQQVLGWIFAVSGILILAFRRPLK